MSHHRTIPSPNLDALPPLSPSATPLPIDQPTNREFLTAVFGDDAGRAWVASVHDGNKADWFGQHAASCDIDAPGFTEGDTYFAVGVLRDGTAARTAANWSHTHLIVVDDVGEKCSAAAVRAALGEPSYVLRTSLGSSQYGYLLRTPLREADTQARIMRALTIGLFDGVDPGHRDNLRYVRLPRGFNSKPKRVRENGGRPQKVVMLEWHPERRVEIFDLILGLDGLPGLRGGTAWAEAEGPSVAHRSMLEDLPKTLEEARARCLPRDYIFAAFDALGRVVGMQGSQGYIEVRCPFEDTHTNDDGRSAWNPTLFLEGHPAFSCFHSDGGADKSNRGIAAALRAELDARDGPGSFDALRRAAIAATFPPLPDTSDNPPDTTADTQADMRSWCLQPLGSSAPTSPPKVRASICSFLARREVTTLAGQPGTGKSAFVLSTALAIAANRPDIIGERAFERTGDVLIVSKEDDYDALLRRRAAWHKQHGVDASALGHEPYFVHAPGFTAARNTGTRVELTEHMDWLALQIAELRRAGRDVCMVVLDTFAAVMDGLPENDNGAMGRVMAELSGWAERHAVSVLVPHHMAKANGRAGGSGDLGSIRGASAIGGGVRLAVTLAEPDDKTKAKLPANVRDDVVVLEGAKANHDAKAARRYFLRETPHVDHMHESGMVVSRRVIALSPYKPIFEWEPESDNAKLAVLSVVAAAEAPSPEHPEGQPIRVNGRGKTKGAIATIAEQVDADSKDVEATIAALLRAGMLVEVPGPKHRNGKSPDVLRVTASGQSWLAKQRDGVLSLGTTAESGAPLSATLSTGPHAG